VESRAHEPRRALRDGLGLRQGALPRLALLVLAMAALAAGMAGGLVRLGAPLPVTTSAAGHGTLMIAGFLGTVISLERAVALGTPLALAAPLASGLGTVALLVGHRAEAAALALLAPALLFAVSVAIVRRQAQVHTVLLAVAAIAWGIGNALDAFGAGAAAPAWWFTFLVLTIAAERLEMTRLVRRPAVAQPLFHGAIGLLVAGAALATFVPAGGVLFGIGLAAVAAWLVAFDIARRTVATTGFSRYAAVALLGGYFWLAVAALAWIAMALGVPQARDAAMHALGLGFVVSMIFGHAPLVVPVIARMRMRFTSFFYVPLALLHVSLLVRLGVGLGDATVRLAGGVLNAAAIVLFALTVLLSLRGARRDTPHAEN
jgi:hypothetical protein